MAAPEAAAAPLSAAPAPAPAAAAPAAPEAAAPPRPDARAWVKAMRGISAIADVVAVRTRDAGPAGAEQLALWADPRIELRHGVGGVWVRYGGGTFHFCRGVDQSRQNGELGDLWRAV